MSPTLSSKNAVLLASAGSRKTTELVERAIAAKDRSILLTTYTQENLRQLKRTFIEKRGCVPPNVTLTTWYSFLIQECARPYQRFLGIRKRIEGVSFFPMSERVRRATARKDAGAYYLTAAGDLHLDRAAEFAWHVNREAGGRVISRLESMFDDVFIDEIQDMAGWDLELLEGLFRSSIAITCVGDLRQATYATANTAKNKKFRGAKLIGWLGTLEKAQVITIGERNQSFRCNQLICDFADALYPHMALTLSKDVAATDHDGVFPVTWGEVKGYVAARQPQILRHAKGVDTQNLPAMNFGAAKGRTFDRVLVFPTKPMAEYFAARNSAMLKDGSRARLYVAATRARYSVAFVTDQPAPADAE